MKTWKKVLMLNFFAIFLTISPSVAFTILSDCLVLQKIGIYSFDSKTARMGTASGIVGLAGHFQDHKDNICTGDYSNIDEVRGLSDEEAYKKIFTVEVQVTAHAGSDSDKWLLHEVEDGYRSDKTLNETTDTNVQLRTIEGNYIFFIGIYGGKSYTWINNNNVVVDISCSSCPNTKPEPLEIVKAYLAKFPSSITLTDAEAKSKAHSETWLKDEMERRLWLGEKWFTQLDLQKAEQNAALKEVVKHFDIFLKYREKYYGIAAKNERQILQNYLSQNNTASLKEKLKEYQLWWAEHKTDGISL